MHPTIFLLLHTGRDFQLHPGSDLATVSNNASNPGRCFRIIITEDSDPEPAENFTISFVVNRTQPEGVNISINQSKAVITIEENDRKSHWFEMIGLRNYMCVQLQTYSVCTVLHHTDIKFGIT